MGKAHGLGFIQEGRAEKALDSIRNMLSAEARTVRGGETRMIAADQLVPGDVVLLESGDKVPADLRLADVNNFRTEEAALTGESVPADKTTDVVSANATVLPGYRLTPTRPKGTLVAAKSENLQRSGQPWMGLSISSRSSPSRRFSPPSPFAP
jgi:P-type E1-E2 ATPase